MKEKMSFSTGALFPLESWDALSKLHKAGFEHAELMPQAFCDVEECNYGKMLGSGIHIASIHYPLAMFSMLYSAHISMSNEGRELSRRIVAFGHAMGSEVIVVHTTSEYTGDMKRFIEPRVKDNICFLADLCAKNSITLAMENHPSGVGQFPDTLEEYIASWNLDVMKPMVDTTESLEGGVDPIEFIAGMKETPCHMHMSDFANGKKHFPLGEGGIDWTGLIALLKERGYQGYWTLEPSYRHYLTDIDEKLRRDFLRLEALL